MVHTAEWWHSVTPERHVPRTYQHGEYTIPAKYHGVGYHTIEPSMPLWKEVLAAMRSPVPPLLCRTHKDLWSLDCAVITSEELALRVAKLLLKHPAASVYDMYQWSGFPLTTLSTRKVG